MKFFKHHAALEIKVRLSLLSTCCSERVQQSQRLTGIRCLQPCPGILGGKVGKPPERNLHAQTTWHWQPAHNIGRGCAQDVVAACDSIAECDLFVYFPLGKSLSNQPSWLTSAFLKTARNPSNTSQIKCAPSFTIDHRLTKHTVSDKLSPGLRVMHDLCQAHWCCAKHAIRAAGMIWLRHLPGTSSLFRFCNNHLEVK